DGQSRAMAYINNPGVSLDSWAIIGETLGASVSSSGVVTAGRQTGTITVQGANGSGTCYQEQLDLIASDSGCGSCGQPAGVAVPGLGSVDIKLPMGWSIVAGNAGHLRINEDQPFQATPSRLHYD